MCLLTVCFGNEVYLLAGLLAVCYGNEVYLLAGLLAVCYGNEVCVCWQSAVVMKYVFAGSLLW